MSKDGKLTSVCDHAFRPVAFAGPVKESMLAVTPVPDAGSGTLRCVVCGKIEVIALPDRGAWWRIVDAVRPIRDAATRRPVMRLPWSAVVRRATMEK